MALDSTRGGEVSRAKLEAYEAELVSRLRHGDTDSATRIFNLYFDRLYSMVFYSVGKDHAVAEDITQDTFVSAFKAARKFKGNSNLYTWLAGIASHKVADHFRHLKKERKHIKSISPSDVSIPGKIEDNLKEALDTFPLTYRQVLLLKYVDDMTVAEISHVLNKTEKSVEGLLSRARKMLRDRQEDL